MCLKYIEFISAITSNLIYVWLTNLLVGYCVIQADGYSNI